MEIEYRLDGPEKAPVLVLSNSLGTTWDMWQVQMPLLRQHFRVLRYNTRGHGGTPLPAELLTLARLGRDVVDLLDALNIERAAFCGISLGGLTGMWLNRYAPERFSAIAIANTAARIGEPEGWLARAKLVREQGMEPVAEGSASRWFTPGFCQQQPEVVKALITTLAGLNPQGYAACCEALATADLRAELPAMTRPMLVIAGSHDPVTGVAEAQDIVTRAADARLITLPASHLSNISCGLQFSQQLKDFICEETSSVVNH